MWRTSEKPDMCCNIAVIFQCSPIRIRSDPEPDPDPNFYSCGFQDAKKIQLFLNFFAYCLPQIHLSL